MTTFSPTPNGVGRLSGSLLRPAAIVSVAGMVLFVLILWDVQAGGLLTRFDAAVAPALHHTPEQLPGLTWFFRWVTDVGSLRTLVAVAIVVGVAVLPVRRYWLLAGWLAALVGGDEVDRLIKELVRRPRPPFQAVVGSWSFPSSHALDALVGFGFLGYIVWLMLPQRTGRVAVVAVVAILVVGFSRLYLGAHYVSDVLGGYAAGAAWLGAWVAGCEALRNFRRRPSL
jgi:undecaprenyl-diphosphatase